MAVLGGKLKNEVVNVAGSGNNTIITAVSGRQLLVCGFFLVAGAAVTARFESGAVNVDGGVIYVEVGL